MPRTSASTAPPGPWATSQLVGLDEVVQLDEVDLVDAEPLERALQLAPGAVAVALAGLRRQEELVAVVGEERRQAQLRLAVRRGRVDVVDAGRRERRSRVRSARSWLIPPRAAAPKMTRLLRWPVRPNAARPIPGWADRSGSSNAAEVTHVTVDPRQVRGRPGPEVGRSIPKRARHPEDLDDASTATTTSANDDLCPRGRGRPHERVQWRWRRER